MTEARGVFPQRFKSVSSAFPKFSDTKVKFVGAYGRRPAMMIPIASIVLGAAAAPFGRLDWLATRPRSAPVPKAARGTGTGAAILANEVRRPGITTEHRLSATRTFLVKDIADFSRVIHFWLIFFINKNRFQGLETGRFILEAEAVLADVRRRNIGGSAFHSAKFHVPPDAFVSAFGWPTEDVKIAIGRILAKLAPRKKRVGRRPKTPWHLECGEELVKELSYDEARQKE